MPHRRHALGKRRVALAAAVLFALSRAWAYSPWSGPTGLLQEPILLATADGRLVTVYALVWAVAGVVCAWHLPTGRLILPLACIVGLMGGWGAAWAWGWLLQPHTAWWQTALTYACPAIIIASLVALTPRDAEVPPEEAL